MTKEELLEKLAERSSDNEDDYELAHIEADKLIIDYINDPEIKAAYERVGRWYS